MSSVAYQPDEGGAAYAERLPGLLTAGEMRPRYRTVTFVVPDGTGTSGLRVGRPQPPRAARDPHGSLSVT